VRSKACQAPDVPYYCAMHLQKPGVHHAQISAPLAPSVRLTSLSEMRSAPRTSDTISSLPKSSEHQRHVAMPSYDEAGLPSKDHHDSC
jgi:hypothetical protein